MDYASIERKIHVDATPETVYEVVSRPEHIKEWWGPETDLAPTPGSSSELVWGDSKRVPITVVAADPPRVFTFRWTHPAEDEPVTGNSLLVTFELVQAGKGTLLTMTETGFRERGWEAAELEANYADHAAGWDRFVPAIKTYADHLAGSQ